MNITVPIRVTRPLAEVARNLEAMADHNRRDRIVMLRLGPLVFTHRVSSSHYQWSFRIYGGRHLWNMTWWRR